MPERLSTISRRELRKQRKEAKRVLREKATPLFVALDSVKARERLRTEKREDRKGRSLKDRSLIIHEMFTNEPSWTYRYPLRGPKKRVLQDDQGNVTAMYYLYRKKLNPTFGFEGFDKIAVTSYEAVRRPNGTIVINGYKYLSAAEIKSGERTGIPFFSQELKV